MSRLNEPTNMRLKDRTYNEIGTDARNFECHRCGYILYYVYQLNKRIKYCPNCGRKVILRSAYETIEKDNTKVV